MWEPLPRPALYPTAQNHLNLCLSSKMSITTPSMQGAFRKNVSMTYRGFSGTLCGSPGWRLCRWLGLESCYSSQSRKRIWTASLGSGMGPGRFRTGCRKRRTGTSTRQKRPWRRQERRWSASPERRRLSSDWRCSCVCGEMRTAP